MDANACRECVRLLVIYDDALLDLDLTMEELGGTWERSEYENRRAKAEEARRDAENARAVFERHRRTHMIMSAVN